MERAGIFRSLLYYCVRLIITAITLNEFNQCIRFANYLDLETAIKVKARLDYCRCSGKEPALLQTRHERAVEIEPKSKPALQIRETGKRKLKIKKKIMRVIFSKWR